MTYHLGLKSIVDEGVLDDIRWPDDDWCMVLLVGCKTIAFRG